MESSILSSQVLRLGTRKSLLAVAQSELVAHQLKSLNQSSSELITIETEGDQLTNKPLWQLDGKDFFTKELDQALLNQQVDYVVHSYKDLGTERPIGIRLAAVTKRLAPFDILLIKKSLALGKSRPATLKVGTSSPRRITNLKSSLAEFLPFGLKSIETEVLRGNVNTRIQKLNNDQYDAIVLAMAGLERLAINPQTSGVLKNLLDGLTFMILPQSTFPSSPAQGALAIECRADDQKTFELLQCLHHAPSAEAIAKERQIFKSYGGGCHLAVGIYARPWREHFVIIQKGEHQNQPIHQTSMEQVSYPPNPLGTVFLGMPLAKKTASDQKIIYDQLITKTELHPAPFKHEHVFVTSTYCLPILNNIQLPPQSLWAAGNKTWKDLARAGHWVNGSADGMGHEEIDQLRQSPLIKMFFSPGKLAVLTKKNGTSPIGDVIACYEHHLSSAKLEKRDAELWKKELAACSVFYWTSVDQYQTYLQHFPFVKNKIHACGLGKTYDGLLNLGLNVLPFFSLQQFKSWAQV